MPPAHKPHANRRSPKRTAGFTGAVFEAVPADVAIIVVDGGGGRSSSSHLLATTEGGKGERGGEITYYMTHYQPVVTDQLFIASQPRRGDSMGPGYAYQNTLLIDACCFHWILALPSVARTGQSRILPRVHRASVASKYRTLSSLLTTPLRISGRRARTNNACRHQNGAQRLVCAIPSEQEVHAVHQVAYTSSVGALSQHKASHQANDFSGHRNRVRYASPRRPARSLSGRRER